MSEPIWVVLTTYKRTSLAIRTVQGLLDHLRWPNIGFMIADDGSPNGHVQQIVRTIGPSYSIYVYDGERRGVGHNSNWGINKVKALGGSLIMLMEDDWELRDPLDMTPFVDLLMNNADMGYIRMGYLSYGMNATLISRENKLWWKTEPNGYQYRYTGHAGLRHIRFHEEYGMFATGLSPGRNELDMCAKVNAKPDGPAIVWPADIGQWGYFSHIGSESLADIPPGG